MIRTFKLSQPPIPSQTQSGRNKARGLARIGKAPPRIALDCLGLFRVNDLTGRQRLVRLTFGGFDLPRFEQARQCDLPSQHTRFMGPVFILRDQFRFQIGVAAP